MRAMQSQTKGVTRVEVEAEPNEPLEKLLRRFSRAVPRSCGPRGTTNQTRSLIRCTDLAEETYFQ